MSVFIGYPSFMAYQMMKGKKGNNDDFPSITGMIARYSASGLTNEQMAANPVWVDKTGNGHDLQLKNFAWKGMSGVGGYVADIDEWGTNSTAAYFERNSIKITATFKENVSLGLLYHNIKLRQSCVLKVTGIPEGCDAFLDDRLGNRFYMSEDGVYEIIPSNFLAEALYFSIEKYPERWYGSKLTIEQLPLYPGFILGDGVDDFAATEKELNFEDTYTVYTAFIPFQDDPVRGMAMCGKDFKKDFHLYYSNTHLVYYTSGLNGFIPVHINQLHIIVCKRDKTNAVIKNLITGESKTFSVSELIDNPGVYYLWRSPRSGTSTAKSAIAGQTICNGYFSTDEDDEKVLDWYKKQYPWLFPNQAWTVVGKTNEDKDRATIANITSNGNNLILSNFGFAENSGYGLYGTNYTTWTNPGRATYTVSSDKIHITKVSSVPQSDFIYVNGLTKLIQKIKVTGLPQGVKLRIGRTELWTHEIATDGIYNIKVTDSSDSPLIGYNIDTLLDSCDITIEQIPDYEGYLVTDGVDDKVESSLFTLNKDWTIVGNWTMLSNIPSNCGIIKVSSMFLYNSLDGVTIYFAGGPIKIQSKSINAFCSDGRIYLNDWTEILKPDAQIASGGSKSSLNIASYSANFTKMAFKNLAIYDGKNLSKDDCIKAYNYLQTLKAK